MPTIILLYEIVNFIIINPYRTIEKIRFRKAIIRPFNNVNVNMATNIGLSGRMISYTEKYWGCTASMI